MSAFYYNGDHIKEGKIGRSCGTHIKQKKFTLGFGEEERMILK
jgi:hypothetical protein